MLEGSVQRDQSRVRVNAQFVDAETGAHLWADRFEEDLADLFKLQDDVYARFPACSRRPTVALRPSETFSSVGCQIGRSRPCRNVQRVAEWPESTPLLPFKIGPVKGGNRENAVFG